MTNGKRYGSLAFFCDCGREMVVRVCESSIPRVASFHIQHEGMPATEHYIAYDDMDDRQDAVVSVVVTWLQKSMDKATVGQCGMTKKPDVHTW